MKLVLGYEQSFASGMPRQRQSARAFLENSQDAFLSQNPQPKPAFGASWLKNSLRGLALIALSGGQACKDDSHVKSPIVVQIEPDVVITGQNDPRYLEVAQGLRQHAKSLLEQPDSTRMNDVQILTTLVTTATNHSNNKPDVFMNLMNEIFFNRLPQKYRTLAHLPPVRMDGSKIHSVGCRGLDGIYNDKDKGQLSKHLWYFICVGYYASDTEAQLGLSLNESKWFGKDPSEEDYRLGKLGILIGQMLRKGTLTLEQLAEGLPLWLTTPDYDPTANNQKPLLEAFHKVNP